MSNERQFFFDSTRKYTIIKKKLKLRNIFFLPPSSRNKSGYYKKKENKILPFGLIYLLNEI